MHKARRQTLFIGSVYFLLPESRRAGTVLLAEAAAAAAPPPEAAGDEKADALIEPDIAIEWYLQQHAPWRTGDSRLDKMMHEMNTVKVHYDVVKIFELLEKLGKDVAESRQDVAEIRRDVTELGAEIKWIQSILVGMLVSLIAVLLGKIV